MATDLLELGRALGVMFGQGLESPSHDELDNAFARSGLAAGDPGRRMPAGVPVGKVKRVRAVFTYATDHNPKAGLQLAEHLVSLLRATSAFMATDGDPEATARVESLQRAFHRLGYLLDASGGLGPLVLDNLHGTQLTDALQGYVRRANLSPDDAALQVGNGKDLDEAAARQVLDVLAGGYSPGTNFPVTLAQAFLQLQLTPADPKTAATLDPDPHRAVQQCLYQLGCAVNRLRNEVGSGHGRPAPSTKTAPITPAEARLVSRSTALVAGMLLDSL